jgi:hypothetical protein
MIASTSLKAYIEDVKPTLQKREKAVLGALLTAGAKTNSELSNYLQWPINCVTGRTNRLVKLGVIKEVRKRKCSVTGMLAKEWDIAPTKEEIKTQGVPRVFWEGRKEELSGQMKLI